MQRLTVVGGLVGVATAGLAALAWTGNIPSPFDSSHGAIGICIEKTKEELRSPSSFKLVWSDYTARPPLTWEESLPPRQDFCARIRGGSHEVMDAYGCHFDKLEPIVREKLRKGVPLASGEESIIGESLQQAEKYKRELEASRVRNLPEDQTGHVTLEYDADNGFGTPIRSFAMCRFRAIGTDGRFQKSEILLSGPIDAAVGQQTKALSEQAQSR